MKFLKIRSKKLCSLAAFIFFGGLIYFAYQQDKRGLLESFIFGVILIVPIAYYKYLIPILSKAVGSIDSLPFSCSDDLLESFSKLLADPGTEEILSLAFEIKRNNLNRASAKAIFEGPLTMICALEWRAASFAMEELFEFSPRRLRHILLKNWRACGIVRQSPLWLTYKFLVPGNVRSGFYEALKIAFSGQTEGIELENLYR